MKTILTSAFVVFFAGVCMAQEEVDIAKSILGKWSYASGKRAGEEVAAERLGGEVTITQETFTLPGGPDATFVMAYKLDTSKNPATVDFEIKEGPVPEGKANGIITLDGDKLWLCYEPMGGARPEKMESTEDNMCHLFEMHRIKENDADHGSAGK